MSNKEKSNPGLLVRFLFTINFVVGASLILAYLSTHISPVTFSYLAFFGLAYPFLIVLSLCFSGLWLFLNRKYLIFNIVVILLGWNHLTDFYSFNNSVSIHSANDLKIVSYNVRIFNYYDIKNRVETRNNIFDFINEQAADIYCFQEFYHQEGGSEFKTRDSIVELLGINHYHERYTHEMTGQKFFGLVTFSKFPIINKGGIAFENDANNYCIYIDIVKDRDTLRVFNAHLGSIRLQNEDYALFGDNESGEKGKYDTDEQKIVERLKVAFQKRSVQIEKVMVEVKASPYPVIFCGDINDTPVSYCYRQISNCLIDAFLESSNGVGNTYIGKIPSNRIDYIFHSKNLQSTEFITHDIEFSDHKPISTYIGNVFDN